MLELLNQLDGFEASNKIKVRAAAACGPVVDLPGGCFTWKPCILLSGASISRPPFRALLTHCLHAAFSPGRRC